MSRFRRAVPESPRPQARKSFREGWYRGRGSNSTAPLCRRGALNQKATPAFWLWGQGSNLRVNRLTASRLATWLPHKNWSGTSDLNRDSLGPTPSGLIRFPSPRNSKSGVSWRRTAISSIRRMTPAQNWGDRRELNPRGQIHSLPPEPLGHGHTWRQEHELNVLVRTFETGTSLFDESAQRPNRLEPEGVFETPTSALRMRRSSS